MKLDLFGSAEVIGVKSGGVSKREVLVDSALENCTIAG
jgi:hypothetical protein